MSFNINDFGMLLKYNPEKLETDVVIPDEAEIIGEEAFMGCRDLNSVVIPESVVEIGTRAFHGCVNLLYIDIPEGVKAIGCRAFASCNMLERVTLPSSLVSLGFDSFQDCERLKEIDIPDKITSISQGAFYSCTHLARVKLPENLIEIEYSAFSECKSLKSIVIPDGAEGIYAEAFSESGLTRAVIPRSVKFIANGAFRDTDNLVTNIPISDWNDAWGVSQARYALNYMNAYTPDDPFLENLKEENNLGIKECICDIELEFSPKADIKAIWYLINEELLDVDDIEFLSEKMIGDAEIVANLLGYKKKHFSAEYMEKWEQDKIDKALGKKEYTFRDWNRTFKLAKNDDGYVIEAYRGSDDTVAVPGKIEGVPVTAIREYAFFMTDNIQSVHIEEGIVQIGTGAFDSCSLTGITLPDTLRSIDVDAFSGCENLTEITIPNEVTDIGEDAFRNCRSLAAVTLPDKITAVKEYTFFDTAISEIVIPEGVMSIEDHAFSCCFFLSDVTFPRSLQIIKGCAFEDCCNIKRIVLYERVNYIDDTAFDGIKHLIIAAPADSYAMDFALTMGYDYEEI